jgi:hypothetical protein
MGFINNNIVSRENMQVFKDLGEDLSSAYFCWVSHDGEHWDIELNDDRCIKDNYEFVEFAYDVTYFLDNLPEYIEVGNIKYYLSITKDSVMYISEDDLVMMNIKGLLKECLFYAYKSIAMVRAFGSI